MREREEDSGILGNGFNEVLHAGGEIGRGEEQS